jgi:hypothetical protein
MSDTPDIVAKLRHELERGDSTIIGNRQVCDRALIEEAAALITSLREALEPFASFAENTTENGWATNIHREGISTWFGPSDFRRARTALNPKERLDALLERARKAKL